jgi:hypothetical protein
MKKKLLMIAVLGSMAGVANAGHHRGGWSGWNPPGGNTPTQVTAPEIDPASAGSALTLLLGGLTVLRSRMARKN